MRNSILFSASCGLVLGLVGAATADNVAISERAPEPTNSINVSPLGVLVGNYALTYEHLFSGSHGLIVEGNFARSSRDDGFSQQYGGAVGYRWHWRGRQNSGFLGVMIAQSFGDGEITTVFNSDPAMTHPMRFNTTTITGNIGKRWMVGPANVTLRFGLGYGKYSATAKEDTEAAKAAEADMNKFLALLPIGFDGELSVGYTF